MLSSLDLEIQQLQSSLDPSKNSYRYDALRLETLRLRRDVIELQEQAKDHVEAITSNTTRLELVELRMGILERALISAVKPEYRDQLTARIADEILKKTKLERRAA